VSDIPLGNSSLCTDPRVATSPWCDVSSGTVGTGIDTARLGKTPFKGNSEEHFRHSGGAEYGSTLCVSSDLEVSALVSCGVAAPCGKVVSKPHLSHTGNGNSRTPLYATIPEIRERATSGKGERMVRVV